MEELIAAIEQQRKYALNEYFKNKGTNRAYYHGYYVATGRILKQINELKKQQNG